VVGFVARRDWLPFDDRDYQAVMLERRRAVALSSAQLERARDFDTGRYLLGRKSRQNACCLVRTSGEEEEADKPLRLDGYAGGRDV
jgi:Rad3-related DNA helicase